jgi:SAM-dependent methyltransferase
VTSPELLESLACPVCLETSGCEACALPARDHALCLRRYAERAGCACGGADKVALARTADGLACPCCGAVYGLRDGVLDLIPRTALGEGTLYAEHEFQERLEVADGPLLLSARIKARQMQRLLRPVPGEALLDLGCGSGRFALFAAEHGARVVGLDLAPFYLPRAVAQIDLVVGDLRRLPFRKASFAGAYSLDVLEHLDEQGVRDVLLEARRVLRAAGRLFVYTHAMESSALARFQRGVNRLAAWLGQRGLVDAERERLRKSDHRNAIRSHEHFAELAADAGLMVRERRYYNVVFKAVVEDLLLRLYEQRRRRRRAAVAPRLGEADGQVKTTPRSRPHGRLALALGWALTELLELDVALFRRIRTGPFFGLLAPTSGERRASREGLS